MVIDSPVVPATALVNALSEFGTKVEVQELAEQVQSLTSHPTVAQTVSGLEMEYPVSQEKIEHVSRSFHTWHPYSAVVSIPLFLHMEVEAAQLVADESYHEHPPCLVPPDVR